VVNAWGQSALPHLSAALANGRIAEFDRTLGRALIAAAIGSVAIGAALWLAWQPIEQHYLLAGKYGDGVLLLWPWAAASGASVLRYVGSIGLMAAREFKFLAKAQTVCGACGGGDRRFHPVAGLYRRDVGHRDRQRRLLCLGNGAAAGRATRAIAGAQAALEKERLMRTRQGRDPQPRLSAALSGAVLRAARRARRL
jgi:hypothetical protein